MRQVNNLKSHWLALIVAIVMVLSGLGFKYYHNHTYAGQPYTETNLSKLTQKGTYNLVFYRPGCAYCYGAKAAVIKASHDSQVPTGFINVKSKSGQRLVSRYHVQKAATIVTIRSDQVPRLYLYAKHDHGRYYANQTVLKEVFNE
ncbi:thioredoxin [Limosilactobacillus reuteri]|uniref:thioredoxin n=1 Tax=Limosilactobacillus reuteri TaxID=1598 RepID=UPI001E41DE3B|nr:thioredoxin [Limosilactobacillus reuteri]MCC4500267.1 thioredoxin [Limosilactobacillus reuteri]MCC4500592.1 thioredoxin [Limosilactobacillus reuteri]